MTESPDTFESLMADAGAIRQPAADPLARAEGLLGQTETAGETIDRIMDGPEMKEVIDTAVQRVLADEAARHAVARTFVAASIETSNAVSGDLLDRAVEAAAAVPAELRAALARGSDAELLALTWFGHEAPEPGTPLEPSEVPDIRALLSDAPQGFGPRDALFVKTCLERTPRGYLAALSPDDLKSPQLWTLARDLGQRIMEGR